MMREEENQLVKENIVLLLDPFEELFCFEERCWMKLGGNDGAGQGFTLQAGAVKLLVSFR